MKRHVFVGDWSDDEWVAELRQCNECNHYVNEVVFCVTKDTDMCRECHTCPDCDQVIDECNNCEGVCKCSKCKDNGLKV